MVQRKVDDLAVVDSDVKQHVFIVGIEDFNDVMGVGGQVHEKGGVCCLFLQSFLGHTNLTFGVLVIGILHGVQSDF